MGVIHPRARRDSRASALSHRNWGFDRDSDFSIQSSSLVEHATANLGSSPGAGMEPSSFNSSNTRTPSRSFYHRSFNTPTGMSSSSSSFDPLLLCPKYLALRLQFCPPE